MRFLSKYLPELKEILDEEQTKLHTDINAIFTEGVAEGLRLIDVAILLGKVDLFKELLAKGAEYNQPIVITPIITKYKGGFIKTDLKTNWYFIESGGVSHNITHFIYKIVNFRNDLIGLTPLALAAALGHADIVKLLIEKGADYKSRVPGIGDGNRRRTPIQIAIDEAQVDVVKVLLNSGVDANSRYDDAENTPLLVQAARGNNAYAIAELLLKAGAEVNPENTPNSPIYEAAAYENVELIQLLINKGADCNVAKVDPEYAAYHKITDHGYTPIFLASCRGYSDVVSKLIENGADFESPLKAGGLKYKTPLTIAEMCDKIYVVRTLLMYYLKKALLSDTVSLRGFIFEQPDRIKAQLKIIYTALMESCEEVVKFHFAKSSSSTVTFFPREVFLKILYQRFIMATGCSISIDSFISVVTRLSKFTNKLDNIDNAHDHLQERIAKQKQDVKEAAKPNQTTKLDDPMQIDQETKKRKRIEDKEETDDLQPPPNKKFRS